MIINPPDTSIHAQESKDDIALSELREGYFLEQPEEWSEDSGSGCSNNGCRKIPEDQTLCNSLYGFILERYNELGDGTTERIVEDLGISRGEFWMEQCTEFFHIGDFEGYEVPEWVISSRDDL